MMDINAMSAKMPRRMATQLDNQGKFHTAAAYDEQITMCALCNHNRSFRFRQNSPLVGSCGNYQDIITVTIIMIR